MSKRRVSTQQFVRIEKKQKSYQQKNESGDYEIHASGLVISRFGNQALIEDRSGTYIQCAIRPAIDSLVAGDQVIWQEEGKEQGVVISRYPRESVLGRPDKKGILKPVAANITQVMIIVAPIPQISWSLLDSYLVMAEHFNLNACIVLNKVDLPCEKIKKRLLEQYETLGYPIVFASNQYKENTQKLKGSLNNQISVFVGQSGVGKSSLIAKLLPSETNIHIGDVSLKSHLGRHTTSNSYYYHLAGGGALIDSPGIRELGLWHMPATEIAKGYREFKPYLGQCKFRNCDHRHTPGCAIRKAVEESVITRDRYNNYVKISG